MIDKQKFIPDRLIGLKQSSKINPLQNILPYISLRYFLGGCRPSKTVFQSYERLITVKFQGSSRPAERKRYLHRQYNFTRSIRKTVTPSFLYSCRTILICLGISLPQDRQSYNRQSLRIIFKSIDSNFPYVNLGKRHCAYFIMNFAHSCVCGQQLQGYCCRVPFKQFFASLYNNTFLFINKRLYYQITSVSFSMVKIFFNFIS